MAFEGLKDQLKEQWADLSAKIQESSAFNNVREKFESQTPAAQRAISLGAVALGALFLLSFPYGCISTSSDYMTEFEENRELIQGLLRVSRSAKEPSPLPPPLDSNALRGRVDAVLRSSRLLPDQIGEMQDMPAGSVKEAPKAVTQNGVAVQIRKINVNQMINIATQLQNIGSGTKLMGLDIVQSKDQTHYYDMIVKVVNFGLPEIADAGPEEPEKPKRGRPARNNDEETGE